MSTKGSNPFTVARLEDMEVFLHEIEDEYIRARQKFDAFNNAHEGYAVMLEEVDEVWSEVKHKTTYQHFREELIQVAAMAMAMALELK